MVSHLLVVHLESSLSHSRLATWQLTLPLNQLLLCSISVDSMAGFLRTLQPCLHRWLFIAPGHVSESRAALPMHSASWRMPASLQC